MSISNQYFKLKETLFESNPQTDCVSIHQKKLNANTFNNKFKDYKMENKINNKANNLNQYDQPNQFYKIGPYILDQVIGKGNFSVVKLAVHTPTQMQVAIKILHKSKMTKDTLEKTYREVHIMKQLSHPYIVRLYQVIESVDWLFIVMEYAPNGELFDHLSQVGRFNEVDARLKFKQILDAVEYCHQMNIVHRDLKAENLLLDKHQNIKLADFGFGSFYENSYLLSTWCGSPPYAAPELFKGEPYIGPKADIWSLGVILYAMVCGTLPFDEPCNIVKLREQVLSGWVRFPYFLSYDCEHLIRMILNRSPNKRPSIANIKIHKWMQPISDSPIFVLEPSMCDSEVWNSPSQIYTSQRCNTLGADSGFDEPINDFGKASSVKVLSPSNNERKDYDFNEHALQIMERCGFNRTEISEELTNKKYGSYTATYLLLCERLRIHRQSYPPPKQESLNRIYNFNGQSSVKNELPIQIRYPPENNQIKPGVTDSLEYLHSEFNRIGFVDRNNNGPRDCRRSPYENIRNTSVVPLDEENASQSSRSHSRRRNSSFLPFNHEKKFNGFVNGQDANSDQYLKHPASVLVDVLIANDQALNNTNESNNQHQNCTLMPIQMNDKIQFLPRNMCKNSPEYLLSYPTEVLNSMQNQNVSPSPCLILDSATVFNDTNFKNGTKFNYDIPPNEPSNPYTNLYPIQPNSNSQVPSLYSYACINHNHKPISNDHKHDISTIPIMLTAQSANVQLRGKNSSFNGVHSVKESLEDQQAKMELSQSAQRHQSSSSTLKCDHNVNGAKAPYNFLSTGLELKSNNCNFVFKPVAGLENNHRNPLPSYAYNTPMLTRTNHYHAQCNEQPNACQFQQCNGRFSFPVEHKSCVPRTEIPVQRIQAFNVIPISKFAPLDVDFIKFS